MIKKKSELILKKNTSLWKNIFGKYVFYFFSIEKPKFSVLQIFMRNIFKRENFDFSIEKMKNLFFDFFFQSDVIFFKMSSEKKLDHKGVAELSELSIARGFRAIWSL